MSKKTKSKETTEETPVVETVGSEDIWSDGFQLCKSGKLPSKVLVAIRQYERLSR